MHFELLARFIMLEEWSFLGLEGKTSRTKIILVFLALSSWTCGAHAHSLPSSYVAAVYEHRVALNPEPRVPLSRAAALLHMRKNLQVYAQQAARAALQGAHILVFPEDGLQGFNFTRSSVAAYLERVPDPQQESWNPCEHPQRHPDTEHCELTSSGALRWGPGADLCLDSLTERLLLTSCTGQTAPPGSQRWSYRKMTGQLIHSVSQLCLEAVTPAGLDVSSLGKEVSDLGQLMSRMAQLMDSFMSRSHAPSVCPTHCSPHHAYLPHPSPPGAPPPGAPHGLLWADTPTSLPCSPQPHAVHLHRPQELHLSFSNITRSTPSPTPQNPAPLLLQPRPPADPALLHLQHSLMPCPSHSPVHGGLYSDDTLWEHSRSATL